VTTGLQLLTLRPHRIQGPPRGPGEATSCLRFSGDGRRLICAADRGTITVWDGTPLASEPPGAAAGLKRQTPDTELP
jgi:hypothetical protein